MNTRQSIVSIYIWIIVLFFRFFFLRSLKHTFIEKMLFNTLVCKDIEIDNKIFTPHFNELQFLLRNCKIIRAFRNYLAFWWLVDSKFKSFMHHRKQNVLHSHPVCVSCSPTVHQCPWEVVLSGFVVANLQVSLKSSFAIWDDVKSKHTIDLSSWITKRLCVQRAMQLLN